MESISVQTVIEVINTLGVTGMLILLFILFYRGDIMSRRVYEELTKHILQELCDSIIGEVKDLVKEIIQEEQKK